MIDLFGGLIAWIIGMIIFGGITAILSTFLGLGLASCITLLILYAILFTKHSV